MKVSLLIASGPHQGEIVPVTNSPFLIGRDAGCNLRPATSVVSKKHCAIVLRDGKVTIVDYGSTNGTFVGNVVLRNREIELEDGAFVTVARYGPLEFTVQIKQEQELHLGTALPGVGSKTLSRVNVASGEMPVTQMRAKTQSVEQPMERVVPQVEQSSPKPVPPSYSDEDSESIAALLLRSDPGDALPEGCTFKITGSSASDEDNENIAAAILLEGQADTNAKKATSAEEMSNAANELLLKLRRTSTPPPGCRFLT